MIALLRQTWFRRNAAAGTTRAQRKSTQSEHAQTGGRVGHQLSESEQATLFFEFLRWNRQNAADTRAAEPSRQTVSP
jgi:hypothetical protein